MKHLFRTGLLTVAWLLVLPCLIVLLSAIFPVVPTVRVYLVDIVPNHAPWLLIWSLLGLSAAVLAHRRKEALSSRAPMAAGTIAVLLAAGVTAHLSYVAIQNGARINLVKALSWRHFSESAAPDETHVYSRPGGEALSLDVYRGRRERPDALTPVVMFIHGGGFSKGSRTFGAANMRWYANHGWTVISIDYRLARDDRPTWNLANRDVECALAWTAEHAGALGLDLHRLTISGTSAGGSLAMAAAYAADTGRADPQCGPHVPHVAAVVMKVPLVDAIGSWNLPRELQPIQQRVLTRYIGGSPTQFPDRYAALNPARYLKGPLPPTLIISGSDDPLVPPQGAAEFVRAARASGHDVQRIVFPYSGHEFNTTYGAITNQATQQIVANFLRAHDGTPTTQR
ncbi:alpha/beta hydrolase [Sphingomonas sp. AP4-R1]|uniref:alpha/beta hydrolase n=1 Tax=Sphingomonas sp. AP4-R1 TaxID=2735134 RepID=UPI001493B197|nr:alpha/beta hydrolase [Sphingomonas sp. AP4-R1]QJU56538.1 alpha/beta hydrolase [Sphingomonas sp. AP4-R1]